MVWDLPPADRKAGGAPDAAARGSADGVNAPPPASPSQYPVMSGAQRGGPAPAAGGSRLGAWGLVAPLLAGVVGALLGAGAVAAVLLRDEADTPASAGSPPSGQRVAPTLELDGLENLDRVAAVAESVMPAVVRLGTGAGVIQSAAFGSGVVIRGDGYIVTNEHVVEGREDVRVQLSDGRELDGSVVGTDHRTDLAVVRVDAGGLTAIDVGDTQDLQVGMPAIAIGSPFGLAGTVTSGVISGLHRPIEVTTEEGSQRYDDVIQTDAAINPGNSGGPLVSAEGRLLGINSAILTRGQTPANAGVGFAIPAETVMAVVERLIADGEVRHAFLGVAGSDVDGGAAGDAGPRQGAYVEEVMQDTPADDAGLAAGDVITGVGGAQIASMTELIGVLLRHEVGEDVTVTFRRDGERQSAEATLAERPEDV